MTAPASTPSLRELTQRFRAIGRIEAILLRPARLLPMRSVAAVPAEVGRGLIGDRRSLASRNGPAAQKREVTLIQAEHLPLLARWFGLTELDPARLRRNLVVSGINLVAMRSLFPGTSLIWQAGDAVQFEITGACEPCSRMEAEFGTGAYNALRGHGGMTARLVTGGTLRVGDSVHLVTSTGDEATAQHAGAARPHQASCHRSGSAGPQADGPIRNGSGALPVPAGAGRPSHAEFFPPED